METCYSAKQPWLLRIHSSSSFASNRYAPEMEAKTPNPELDPRKLSVRKESVMQTSHPGLGDDASCLRTSALGLPKAQEIGA